MGVQSSRAFNFLTDLDPVLSEIFYQKYRQFTPILLTRVIGVRSSDKAKETHRRISPFGDPQPWEGQVAYTSVNPGYEVEWSHTKYTLGFKVERELIMDNQYQVAFDQASELGTSFNRKVVKDEASIFENAFDGTNHAGYDGKALIATDHPRSKSDSTSVDNSLGTKALTDQNLEDAIVKLEGLGDENGNEINNMATHLVVGRQNRKKALELTGSTLDPESAENAINTHQLIQPVVHPYITSKKWFVVDAPMAMMQVLWYWREAANFDSDTDKSNTQLRSFFGLMRYSFGWQDFRWVVGSNAS